jgi:hypothetical membrane protein
MDTKDLIIQILHIFVFGVFLLYLGIAMPTINWIYNIVLILGIFILIYWIATLMTQSLFWIIWHLLIGIILILVGIYKQDTPYFVFNLLIIIGSGAIGYHLTRLIENIH